MRLVGFVISRGRGIGWRSTVQLCSVYFLRYSYRFSVDFSHIKYVGSFSLLHRSKLKKLQVCVQYRLREMRRRKLQKRIQVERKEVL